MAAIDFISIDVWTTRGLVTFYLRFVMELKTRRVHFAGCTTNPHEAWMQQKARAPTNDEIGFLKGKGYLIMDCDSKFSESFRSFLSDQDVKPVRLPPWSPNMNAHLERFVGSLKSECPKRFKIVGSTTATRVPRFDLVFHPHGGTLSSISTESPGLPSDEGVEIVGQKVRFRF